MNPIRIVIDGKAYNSVEEMPVDVRKKCEEAMRIAGSMPGGRLPQEFGLPGNILADNDSDGIPDIVGNAQAVNLSSGMKILFDGQAYSSADELPPEVRAKYEQAVAALDKNRNGIPDFVEGMMNVSSKAQPPISITASSPSMPPQKSLRLPTTSTIEPEATGNWMIIIGLIIAMILCATGAAGIWYFFLR